MCGIAGYLGSKVEGLNERLVRSIERRGPDGQSTFEEGPVHFAHSRLAIVDIPDGGQPMEPPGTDCVVIYNGEIYNYDELRQRLEKAGLPCRTTCDTELIPLGYRAFGLDFFAELNGMFAFALFDRRSGEVHLARDPWGIKPLHVAQNGATLVFGSSATTVALHPDVDRSLNAGSVRDFLQFRYVPDGASFYGGVKSLPPGTLLTWRDGKISSRRFRPAENIEIPATPDAWRAELQQRLERALTGQLRSDVPVGVFLSGGVDSGVVATLAARSAGPPKIAFTFAIAGDTQDVEGARRIAERTGMTHKVVEGGQGLEELPQAIADMDLPVGDAIVLPTWQLCRSAAQDVKVVLTGEGADELFGGYVHIPTLRRLDRLAGLAGLIAPLAPLIKAVPIRLLDTLLHYQASLGTMGRQKVQRLLENAGRPQALYRTACSIIDDTEISQASILPPVAGEDSTPSSLDLRTLLDDGLTRWLPYQILNKMDALSMAHGLEARVPFLDHQVTALVSLAPPEVLAEKGENKALLRKVATQIGMPEARQPKHAFHVPVERSHQVEIRKMCDDWLNGDQIRRHGILRECFVTEARRQFDRGEFIASKQLVAMSSLHMWLDANGAPA